MRKIIALVLTLAVIILAGCSAGAGIDESFKGSVEPIAENILQGIKNNDRDSFIKDMDDKMKSAFTEESFKKMNDMLASKVGSYQSKEYWKAEKSGDYRIAYYKAKFDKEGEYVVVKVVTSEKNGTLYVSGLFFDSPNLRK